MKEAAGDDPAAFSSLKKDMKNIIKCIDTIQYE